MASNLHNLSEFTTQIPPHPETLKIAIIVSEWNAEITNALYQGAYNTLLQYGISARNIFSHTVPGSYELPAGAQYVIESKQPDAVICLGCVIQGETRHFEFICQAVSQGIMQVNLKTGVPVIFGVLTTDNQQQAIDRSGGKYGNKGDEAAIAALKMIQLRQQLQ